MFRAVVAGVLLALCASDGGAQITTYVPPPRPVAPSPLAAAADSVRRDSIAQAAVTNMKAWVDSAAGVSVPAHVGDSVARPTIPDPPIPEPARPVDTTFEDGAVAPATASNLPTISVLGLLAVVCGAVILARRRRS
jgi:hypothetical protein